MAKLFVQSLYCLLIGICFFGCRQAEPGPNPLFDGTPRLKSISLAGIPQENVTIDHKKRVVTVKMPPIILDKVSVTFELTDNAELVQKNFYIVTPNLFGCESCFQITLKDKKDTYNSLGQTTYIVKTLATGPVQLALLSQPLSYTIKDQDIIEVPAVHLYGNKLPKEAHLLHSSTGERFIVKRNDGGSSLGVQYGRTANRISLFLFTQKLLPGSYQIEFVFDDASIQKVSQPLLVSKGTPSFDYEAQTYFGYRVATGKAFTVKGYNLFEGDIAFSLLDRHGKTHTLPGLVFDKYGEQLQVTVPGSLAPGQYVLQVYIKAVKQPYCLRVNVLKDEKERPILGTLVEPRQASPCSLLDPVVAQRGVALFFTSNQDKQSLSKLAQQVVLKLVAVDKGDAYYASVVPYDNLNSGFPGSFTIPTTVPSGLYTAILQVLDAQSRVMNESEPYGRLLDVK